MPQPISQPRSNAIAFSKMIHLLTVDSYSCHSLAEETGLHYVSVCRWLHWLRKEKVVRIARWTQAGNGTWTLPEWKMCHPDNSKHASKPPPRTAAQRQKDKRERAKERAKALQLTISRLHEPVQNVN